RFSRDWSSDVCSSDLLCIGGPTPGGHVTRRCHSPSLHIALPAHHDDHARRLDGCTAHCPGRGRRCRIAPAPWPGGGRWHGVFARSEERRVGECGGGGG